MPNWCFNTIKISGPTDEVNRFLGHTNNEPYPNSIPNILETHAPIGEWDHSVAVQNWSTKWDFDLNIGNPVVHPSGYCVVEGDFETAWSPATDGWKKIATKFPKLNFVITFIEEGMCFYGYDIYNNGQLVDEMGEDLPDIDGDSFDDIRENLYGFFDDFTHKVRTGNYAIGVKLLSEMIEK
jgi:hypothetical protein